MARRGLPLLRAKRVLEEVLATGNAIVTLPTVDDPASVLGELRDAGLAVALAEPRQTPDVRDLRRRLGLTREQFAIRYGLDVETVRNWEAGRREPDRAARSYLIAIANDPARVAQAYAPTPA